MQVRATALSDFQGMHENMYLANITEFNPLKDGDFVLAMKPGASSFEIVLGKGLWSCRVIYWATADFP